MGRPRQVPMTVELAWRWRHSFACAASALWLFSVSIVDAQTTPVWEQPGLEGARIHTVRVEQTPHGYRYSTATFRYGDAEETVIPTNLNGIAETGSGSVHVYSDLPNQIAQTYAEALGNGDDTISQITGIQLSSGHHYSIFVTPSEATTNRRWHFERRANDPLLINLIIRRDRVGSVLQSHAIGGPIHERYHLNIQMLGRGAADPRAAANPVAADIYEEVSAFLYGVCGSLLSIGYVTQFSAPGMTLVSSTDEGAEYPAPYSDDILDRLLDVIEAGQFTNGEQIPHGMHLGINLTLWAEISGGQWAIVEDSLEAEALIDGCRYSAPDPFRVAAWLRQLASDGRDAPEMEDRYEAFERLETLHSEVGASN